MRQSQIPLLLSVILIIVCCTYVLYGITLPSYSEFCVFQQGEQDFPSIIFPSVSQAEI